MVSLDNFDLRLGRHFLIFSTLHWSYGNLTLFLQPKSIIFRFSLSYIISIPSSLSIPRWPIIMFPCFIRCPNNELTILSNPSSNAWARALNPSLDPLCGHLRTFIPSLSSPHRRAALGFSQAWFVLINIRILAARFNLDP
jgi:hypothetical protein